MARRRRKQTRAQRAASLKNLRKARAAQRRGGRKARNPESKRKRSAAAKKGAAKRKRSAAPKKTTHHVHITVDVAGRRGGNVTARERKAGTLGKKGRGRKVVRASYGI
jgi:hypothetical protein